MVSYMALPVAYVRPSSLLSLHSTLISPDNALSSSHLPKAGIAFYANKPVSAEISISTQDAPAGSSLSISLPEPCPNILAGPVLTSLKRGEVDNTSTSNLTLSRPDRHPSFHPPKTELALYATKSDSSAILVPSQGVPSGLLPSIGTSGELIFYSVPAVPKTNEFTRPVSMQRLQGHRVSTWSSPGTLAFTSTLSGRSELGGGALRKGNETSILNATDAPTTPLAYTPGSAAPSITIKRAHLAGLLCAMVVGELNLLSIL